MPDLVEWHDHAVERVLEADHARRTPVDVVAQDDVFAHVLERKVAPVAWLDGRELGSAERRNAGESKAVRLVKLVMSSAFVYYWVNGKKEGVNGEIV